MSAIIFNFLLDLVMLLTNFGLPNNLCQVNLHLLAKMNIVIITATMQNYFWKASFRAKVGFGPSRVPSVTSKISVLTIA